MKSAHQFFQGNTKLLSITLISLSALSGVFGSMRTSMANERVFSYESHNFRGQYIRHQDLQGYLGEVNSALDRTDASFREIRGLANSNCRSFESLNFPGHYLRHQNYRVVLSLHDGSSLFREDATFCEKPALFGREGISFESYNFPGHFIRHKNFEVWIETSDGSDLFRKDATFYRQSSLAQ